MSTVVPLNSVVSVVLSFPSIFTTVERILKNIGSNLSNLNCKINSVLETTMQFRDEVNNSISSLKENLTSLNDASISSLRENLTSLNDASISSLRENLTSHNDASISSLRENLTSLNNGMSNLSIAISNVNKALQEHKKQTEIELADLHTSLASTQANHTNMLNVKIDSLEECLSQHLETTMQFRDEVNNSISSLRENLTSLNDASISSLKENLTSHNDASISSLRDNLTSLNNGMSNLSIAISNVNKALQEHKKETEIELADLHTSLASTQANHTNMLNVKIDSLEECLSQHLETTMQFRDEVNNSISSLRENLTSLNDASISSLKENLTSHNDASISSLRENLTSHNDASISSLRENLTSLNYGMSNLSIAISNVNKALQEHKKQTEIELADLHTSLASTQANHTNMLNVKIDSLEECLSQHLETTMQFRDEVNNSISSLRENLTSLNDASISSLRENLTSHNDASISSLRENLTSLNYGMSNLSIAISNVNKVLQEHKRQTEIELADLYTSLASTQANHTNMLNVKIDSLEECLSQHLETTMQFRDEVNNSISSLRENLTSLNDASISSLRENLTSLNYGISNLSIAISNVNKALQEHKKQTEIELADLHTSLASTQANHTNMLNVKIDSLEECLSEHKEQVTGKLNALQTSLNLTSLNDAMSNFSIAISNVNKALQEHKKQTEIELADLLTSLASTQANHTNMLNVKIDSLEECLSQHLETTMQFRDEVNNSISSLRENLTSLNDASISSLRENLTSLQLWHE